MDGYSLFIKPSAMKELEGLPRNNRRRIATRIETLGMDPRPRGCERLSGEDKHRLRQGDYRVVYQVDDGTRTVTIVKIGHR